MLCVVCVCVSARYITTTKIECENIGVQDKNIGITFTAISRLLFHPLSVCVFILYRYFSKTAVVCLIKCLNLIFSGVWRISYLFDR